MDISFSSLDDITSCVMNGGFASDMFFIERDVRQGDPLSPYSC